MVDLAKLEQVMFVNGDTTLLTAHTSPDEETARALIRAGRRDGSMDDTKTDWTERTYRSDGPSS